jgi:nucleoside-diphosphate-sugar epimerase
MKVLLTGHQGYIGSVGSAMIKEAGHEVVGLDTGLLRAVISASLPLRFLRCVRTSAT